MNERDIRHPELDQVIAACSLVIGRPEETPKKRAEAYHDRAEAHFAKGDCDRALADLHEVIALEPGNAMARRDRAALYEAKGDLSRAIAEYSEALRLDPADPEALTSRSRAYRAMGDARRADADLADARDRGLEMADALLSKPAAVEQPTDMRIVWLLGLGATIAMLVLIYLYLAAFFGG